MEHLARALAAMTCIAKALMIGRLPEVSAAGSRRNVVNHCSRNDQALALAHHAQRVVRSIAGRIVTPLPRPIPRIQCSPPRISTARLCLLAPRCALVLLAVPIGPVHQHAACRMRTGLLCRPWAQERPTALERLTTDCVDRTRSCDGLMGKENACRYEFGRKSNRRIFSARAVVVGLYVGDRQRTAPHPVLTCGLGSAAAHRPQVRPAGRAHRAV